MRNGKEGERIAGLTLLEVMAGLPDPRSGHGRRHPLGAVRGPSVFAVLSGAGSLYAIAQWGRNRGLEVSQALGFSLEISLPEERGVRDARRATKELRLYS